MTKCWIKKRIIALLILHKYKEKDNTRGVNSITTEVITVVF